jgi:hypothetical protein
VLKTSISGKKVCLDDEKIGVQHLPHTSSGACPQAQKGSAKLD